ncbi:MAG: hypothetical protein LBU36_06800 [Clostridiales bacterium]|jgi:hypothetical protein|nr:hypothetical protein [Clostridiales bacterium]
MAFEPKPNEARGPERDDEGGPAREEREESLLAFKVYDSCRAQECLTDLEIGPAKAAEDFDDGAGFTVSAGQTAEPPAGAGSASAERLTVKKIAITGKEPNPFERGYWDIDVKYVFGYTLVFRDGAGAVVLRIPCENVYSKRVTLYGGAGAGLSMAVDLLPDGEVSLGSEPFVLAEAKAVELECKIRAAGGQSEVALTIGLFSVIRTFRAASLCVLASAPEAPKKCRELPPVNPCEFFEKMDFPKEIFD